VRRALPLLVLAAFLAGCGGTSTPNIPTIQPAKVYRLAGFQPGTVVRPGRPVTVSFTVQQPNGRPLTAYRTGPGPHTGIHLIIVKQDLSAIIHRHPPIGADGRIDQVVTFSSPGPYHVLADVYPKSAPSRAVGTVPNFQLTDQVRVAGRYRAKPLPAFAPRVDVGGYHVVIHGKPSVRAFFPAILHATITDPQGKPLVLHPWYGALAHAIFFRQGNLAYFHTHICGANTPGCTSILGKPSIKATSTAPGQLRIGVLLPQSGTWRLFLQFQAENGKILTAPYTLRVR
jgi:hypothetical protein